VGKFLGIVSKSCFLSFVTVLRSDDCIFPRLNSERRTGQASRQ
jgi:hypothetical protein